MKLSAKVWVLIAVLVTLALASDGAVAQRIQVSPGIQAVRPNDTSSQLERIAALEQQVAQLATQVKTLNTKLEQTSKTAFDANFKAGLGQVWVNSYGDGAVKAAQWVNANGVVVAQNSTAQAQQSGKLDKLLTITSQLKTTSDANATTMAQLKTASDAIQTTLTDIQHRQAITCYGVFVGDARDFAQYQGQEFELCSGRFWNPGVVTNYLNKMIPFKY